MNNFIFKIISSAQIVNKHLEKIIFGLEWKNLLEFGKNEMNTNLNLGQSKHIANLEEIIEKSNETISSLREKFLFF